ncbi:MAG: tRNA (adenosine(37)-N6)-threonylcarbamoyltransferase complex dimerization subunit type 1 TsaB [bacterium]|nr:tRNA (adenosine(37)-N6)-threonylcarbamoyltransferase complex dimerization subunit type 1 TsaB [bacterium]
MKVLYLDTSSSFLYCALIEDEKTIFQITKRFDKDLSKYTISNIKEKFEEKNISTDSVEKIIVVNGPGSFTGIRIGITICKTFAWAKKIPITTISSLKAMALSTQNKSKYIIPIIDARRGYVYAAIYNNESEIILEEQYCSLESLLNYINFNIGNNYTIITNDVFNFKTEQYIPNYKKIIIENINLAPVDPHQINANYLKKTEAEEKYDINC